MAQNEKPSRLGRGLDALLSRKEVPRPVVQPQDAATATTASNTTALAEVSGQNDTGARGGSQQGSAIGNTAAASPSPAASSSPTSITQPATGETASALRNIPIAQIAANPFQPRKEFRPDELAELESSLRASGILQPITVRPSPHHSGYELIAGERRLRAATRLGWTEIPALVRQTDDRTMLTLAMVENLQRADLDPIDEADGYQRLIEEFTLTQLEVADVVGKDRSTIANALRLLALPASVKRLLQDRQITVGHARALLPLGTERAMSDMSREIVAHTLSVRDVEQRVRGARATPATTGRKTNSARKTANDAAGKSNSTAESRRVEELLRKKLQTTVSLHLTGKEKGEVRIAFFSNDDLERVLAVLGISLDN